MSRAWEKLNRFAFVAVRRFSPSRPCSGVTALARATRRPDSRRENLSDARTVVSRRTGMSSIAIVRLLMAFSRGASLASTPTTKSTHQIPLNGANDMSASGTSNVGTGLRRTSTALSGSARMAVATHADEANRCQGRAAAPELSPLITMRLPVAFVDSFVMPATWALATPITIQSFFGSGSPIWRVPAKAGFPLKFA